MPPTVTNQASPPHRTPRAAFNARKGLLLVVLLIIILAGGLWWHDRSNHNAKQANANQPYAYTYKSVHAYKLAGTAAGSGASFSLPKELTTDTASGTGESQVDFEQHAKSTTSSSVVTAELAAAAVPAGSAFSDYNLKTLNSNMSAAVNSPAYKTATGALKEFVVQRVNGGSAVTLGKAAALHTANITANAWQLSVSASPKAGSNSAGPSLQGVAILAMGKSTAYYFLVDSVNYNWTANQTIWQQVTNSLKIDQ